MKSEEEEKALKIIDEVMKTEKISSWNQSNNGDIRVHQLKTVEPYFSEAKLGNKTFEVRKFDRDFKIGDFLELVLYDPKTNELGERLTRRVTYMLTDKPYVPDDYVVLGMVTDEI